MNNIVLDHQVFVDELGPVGVVGQYTPDLGGRIDYILRFFPAEEVFDCFLVGEVVFGVGCEDEIGVAFRFQVAENG